MSEGSRGFMHLFELEFLPEERLRPSRSMRILMALGGATCLIFGFLTCRPEWAYAYIDVGAKDVLCAPIITAFGGALGLASSLRRGGRRIASLNLWGIFIALLGQLLSLIDRESSGTGLQPAVIPPPPGPGFLMTLIGILLMFLYPIYIGMLPKNWGAVLFALLGAPTPMAILWSSGGIGSIYYWYTRLLFWILLAIVFAIPIRIRFMALPGRSTKAQSSQMLQACMGMS